MSAYLNRRTLSLADEMRSRAARHDAFILGCDYRLATLMRQRTGTDLFMGKRFTVSFDWPEGEPDGDALNEVLRAFIQRGEQLQREVQP